jgi:hypothetical protein
MARKRKPAIREKDLQGFKYFQYFKYFQKLLPLLDRLHDHRPPTTDHRLERDKFVFTGTSWVAGTC